MRTTKKLLIAVTLVVVVTFGVLAITPSRSSELKANFDRVQVGMGQAEVDRIFGREGKPWVARRRTWTYWQADDGSRAYVLFLGDYVRVKQWANADETHFDRIRDCVR